MIVRDRSFALFCFAAAGAVAFNVAATAVNALRGQSWQAALTSLSAALCSLALLRGVYDAERQAAWRRRERERDDRAGLEAAVRFPRREPRS